MTGVGDICWWCKNEANTREHIFKKSDLKRIYGNTSYIHESAPIIDNGINQRKVQGPNSKFLKWPANLCSNCNNARSSSFDKAYDEFIKTSGRFFFEVLKNGFIDLKLVFGEDWKIQFDNLLKYYIKHIGCRLSSEKLNVPKNIIDFLNSDDKLKDIAYTFEVRPMNMFIAETSNEMNGGTFEVLKAGPIHTLIQNESGKKPISAHFSWLTTGWVSFNYLIEDRVAPHGMNNLKDSVLMLDIGPIMSVEELNKFLSIGDKISSSENLERVGDSGILQMYYTKIKRRILM